MAESEMTSPPTPSSALAPNDANPPSAPELRASSLVLKSILPALGAAVSAVAKVVLFHTFLLGLALITLAFWAGFSVGLIRGIAAAGTTFAVHIFITPFLVVASATIALGATVLRLGIARALLYVAAERAAALNPRIREENDYAAVSKALTDAFDSLSGEVADGAPGGFRWVRSLTARLGKRLIQLVGRYALAQFELAHREGRPAPYRTLDEWLGARIDAHIAAGLAEPSKRLIVLLLIIQTVLTVGVIAGAMTLPPLWGAAPTPAPTYP
jgi:hypothetical protein